MSISALGTVLLAGCATLTGDIEGARRSWQDARYEDVVSKWGAPARHAALADGRDVYTWESTRSGGSLSPGSVGIFGGSGVGVGVVFGLPGMGSGEHQRCERILTFRDGRVVEQAWYGSPALCSQLKRK